MRLLDPALWFARPRRLRGHGVLPPGTAAVGRLGEREMLTHAPRFLQGNPARRLLVPASRVGRAMPAWDIPFHLMTPVVDGDREKKSRACAGVHPSVQCRVLPSS